MSRPVRFRSHISPIPQFFGNDFAKQNMAAFNNWIALKAKAREDFTRIYAIRC